MESVVDDLLACLDDPRLPLLQWSELYAVAQSRLPSDLAAQLEHIVGEAGACSRAEDWIYRELHVAACRCPARKEGSRLASLAGGGWVRQSATW